MSLLLRFLDKHGVSRGILSRFAPLSVAVGCRSIGYTARLNPVLAQNQMFLPPRHVKIFLKLCQLSQNCLDHMGKFIMLTIQPPMARAAGK
jgi:hypothetical protein